MAQSVVVLGLMGNSAKNISEYQSKKMGSAPPLTHGRVEVSEGLGWSTVESLVRLRKNDEHRHYTEIHFDNPASLEHAVAHNTKFKGFDGPRPLRIAILGHGSSEETRLGWESEFGKGTVGLDLVAKLIANNLAAGADAFTLAAPLKISLLACEGAAWHDPKRALGGQSGSPAFSMAGRLLTELQSQYGIAATVTAYWRVTVSSIQGRKRMILKFGEAAPEGLWQQAMMTFFNTGVAPYSEQGIGAKLKFSMVDGQIEVRCKNLGYQVISDDQFIPMKAALCTELMKFELPAARDLVVKATTYREMYDVATSAVARVKQREECKVNSMKYIVLSSLEGRLRQLAVVVDD